MGKIYSPEQDPIDHGQEFLSTESDKNTLQKYRATGSLLTTKMLPDLRIELLDELRHTVSSNKMARKFLELLDAQKEIKDANGKVILRQPDHRTQLKTLELLTEVRGDTAPRKSVTVTVPFNPSLDDESEFAKGEL